MAPGLEDPTLMWSLKESLETPSVHDGYEAWHERLDRFYACQMARRLLRDLFPETEQAASQEKCQRIHTLSCLYVNLYFMFCSMKREETEMVVVASVFLASKVNDLPRKMKNVLRALNQHRVQDGEPELTEDELRSIWTRALQLENALCRIIDFDFDIVAPFDEINTILQAIMVPLSQMEVFKKTCDRGTPQQEAADICQKVNQCAECFLMDCYMGMAPMVGSPREVAAACIALALRYTRRQLPLVGICEVIAKAIPTLPVHRVQPVLEECLYIFKCQIQSKKAQSVRLTLTSGHAGTIPHVPIAHSTGTKRKRQDELLEPLREPFMKGIGSSHGMAKAQRTSSP